MFVWLFFGGVLSVLFHCLFFRKHIHAEGGFFGGDDKSSLGVLGGVSGA